jgi:hypothetical protein
MKYALFMAIPSGDANAQAVTLSQFQEHIDKNVERFQGCKELLPGVWECDLSQGAHGLAHLVLLARVPECRLATRVLFLDDEPSWIITPPAE